MDTLKRLTRPADEYECRIIDCPVYDWFVSMGIDDAATTLACDYCPFEEIVNRLAKYEDMLEGLTHD